MAKCKKCEKKKENAIMYWGMFKFILIGWGIAFIVFSVFQDNSFIGTVQGILAAFVGTSVLFMYGYGEYMLNKEYLKELDV